MSPREKCFDAVDATIFSGDTLHDPEDRAIFAGYLARWNTAFGETQETEPTAPQGVTNEAEIRRVIRELRAYSPPGDQYKGAHIHGLWARELEAALAQAEQAAPPTDAEVAAGVLGIDPKDWAAIEAAEATEAAPAVVTHETPNMSGNAGSGSQTLHKAAPSGEVACKRCGMLGRETDVEGGKWCTYCGIAQPDAATPATEPAAPGYVSGLRDDAVLGLEEWNKKVNEVLAAATTVQGKEKP